MNKPLSPAAQAVLDAVITDNQTGPERFHARAYATAALRAAAEQDAPSWMGDSYQDGWSAALESLETIAAELEAHHG